MYEVTVGNIGTVYSGEDEVLARNTYEAYVGASRDRVGRAAGEPVTLTCDGEVAREFAGDNPDNDWCCDEPGDCERFEALLMPPKF